MSAQQPIDVGAMHDDAHVAAENVKTAVDCLSARVPNIANPAAVGPLLGVLIDAQRELSAIYDQLHTWHAGTVDGTHFAGYNEHGTEISHYRAAVYCRTAAARGEAASAALRRALRINQTLHWFDTGTGLPTITPSLVDTAIYESLCALRAAQRTWAVTESEDCVRKIELLHTMIGRILGIDAAGIISTAHEVLYLPTEESAPIVLWHVSK
ncbi:hypothetical protein [Williamsia sp.]|uniref:hypothetical protein n=1 Tax=Williamsia sp. TaxID=1872085 RepID=UPI001A27B685|nr:hypothetical protein [Williamsia sp.]MBJ7287394.1 hypothetical protein [Williamsia sp.]